MLCCVSWIFTAIAILVGLLYLKKKKTEKSILLSKEKYRNKVIEFGDSEIREFDPESCLMEDDYIDLKRRLSERIVNDYLEDSDNNPYGTPNFFVNEVADYICDKFNYRNVINVLKQFDHFKTVIGDVDLHFIHMTGKDPSKKIPILLLNGFPSTVWEFHKSIPKLLEAGYTLVVPSLPCHGFTAPPKVPGVSPAVIACVYHKLMLKLGYNKYVIHGGDWGSIIGNLQTFLFPENVVGFHLTLNLANQFSLRSLATILVGSIFPSFVYKNKRQEAQFHPLNQMMARFYEGMAYFHVQSVLPDTFGYGMLDSPVGLIAWHGATYALTSGDRVGIQGAKKPSNKEIIVDGMRRFGIDNIASQMYIFWCMKNAQASMRIYYEYYNNDMALSGAVTYPDIPIGASTFANEVIHLTEFVTRGTYQNLKMFTTHESGGHFAHIDETDLAVNDVLKFMELVS